MTLGHNQRWFHAPFHVFTSVCFSAKWCLLFYNPCALFLYDAAFRSKDHGRFLRLLYVFLFIPSPSLFLSSSQLSQRRRTAWNMRLAFLTIASFWEFYWAGSLTLPSITCFLVVCFQTRLMWNWWLPRNSQLHRLFFDFFSWPYKCSPIGPMISSSSKCWMHLWFVIDKSIYCHFISTYDDTWPKINS